MLNFINRNIETLEHIFYIFSFVTLFLPSCDARLDFDMRIFYFFIIILCILSAFKNKNPLGFIKVPFRRKNLILWILLIISFFPSIFLGETSITTVIKYCFLYVFYFILLNNGSISMNHITASSFIINLYILFRCIELGNITLSHYQGIANNSNQFAMILIGGVIGTLYLICRSTSHFIRFILCCFELSFISLMVYSSSRTNMLALLLAVCLIIILTFKYIKCFFKERFPFKTKYFIIIFLLILLFVLIIFKPQKAILSFFFAKWDNTNSNLLSGRWEIWTMIIQNSYFFLGANLDLNANSEFFNWMNQFGIISLVLYIVFLFSTVSIAIKNCFLKRDLVNIFCLVIILTYIIIMLFENIFTVFGKPINIMFLWSLGYALHIQEDLISTPKMSKS